MVLKKIAENKSKILQELIDAQGKPVDIGGYYEPTETLVTKQMRPSTTFNSILSEIK